jgi:Het-E N-terminal domain
MDPITAAILAALAAGVLSGTTEVGKNLVVDAYHALKDKLKQRLGSESRVVKSVQFLEESPDSEASKALVHEAVVAAKADQDPDLQQAAQALRDQVHALPGGAQYIQNVTGNYNASTQGGGSASVTVNNPPKEP